MSGMPCPWTHHEAPAQTPQALAARDLAKRAELAALQQKPVTISPEFALRLATWLSEGNG